MRRSAVANRLLAALSLLGLAAATTACEHKLDAGCTEGTCHVNLRTGGSLTLGDQDVVVQKVEDTSITLSANGVSFHMAKDTDIHIGQYRLHLGHISGGTASVDVVK